MGTPTWPPSLCLGTPTWLPLHHLKTLYTFRSQIRRKWQHRIKEVLQLSVLDIVRHHW